MFTSTTDKYPYTRFSNSDQSKFADVGMNSAGNFVIDLNDAKYFFIERGTGNIGLNTLVPTERLSVNGGANKTGGAMWSNFSDVRIKKDIVNYTKGLKEIMNIRPVSFKYNEKGPFSTDGKTYVGVIAQEIEKVLPSTVSKIKTKDFEDLREYDSSELTYTLIIAIKEQQAQIEALKAEIKELKSK